MFRRTELRRGRVYYDDALKLCSNNGHEHAWPLPTAYITSWRLTTWCSAPWVLSTLDSVTDDPLSYGGRVQEQGRHSMRAINVFHEPLESEHLVNSGRHTAREREVKISGASQRIALYNLDLHGWFRIELASPRSTNSRPDIIFTTAMLLIIFSQCTNSYFCSRCV
jgi:hypothetical protein